MTTIYRVLTDFDLNSLSAGAAVVCSDNRGVHWVRTNPPFSTPCLNTY